MRATLIMIYVIVHIQYLHFINLLTTNAPII